MGSSESIRTRQDDLKRTIMKVYESSSHLGDELSHNAYPFVHCGSKRQRTGAESNTCLFDCCNETMPVFSKPHQIHQATKVSFAETVVTREVPSPWSYDEAVQQWYTDQELGGIKTECDETIDLVLCGHGLPDTFCKRGLEHDFRDSLSFLESREQIIAAILDKQVDMWSRGCWDQEYLLAELCSRYSCPHVLLATMMGHHDWKLAQDESN